MQDMTIKAVLAAAVVALVASAASASAQALGDIAKKEEARRKTVKTPGRLYTNESLRAEGEPPPATDITPTPAAPAPAASGAQAPATAREDRVGSREGARGARSSQEGNPGQHESDCRYPGRGTQGRRSRRLAAVARTDHSTAPRRCRNCCGTRLFSCFPEDSATLH